MLLVVVDQEVVVMEEEEEEDVESAAAEVLLVTLAVVVCSTDEELVDACMDVLMLLELAERVEDTELVSAMLDEVEVLSESSSNMSTIAADTFEHQRGGDLKKLN